MNVMFPAAELEARRMGEKEPGTEHLVLAVLELPEGSARRAFARIDADPGAFRVAIVRLHDEVLRAAGIQLIEDDPDETLPASNLSFSPTRTSPTAQKVFKQAVKLVREEKSRLYGAYIVMVATQCEQGTTARALRSMGTEPTTVAAACRAEIEALKAADG